MVVCRIPPHYVYPRDRLCRIFQYWTSVVGSAFELDHQFGPHYSDCDHDGDLQPVCLVEHIFGPHRRIHLARQDGGSSHLQDINIQHDWKCPCPAWGPETWPLYGEPN